MLLAAMIAVGMTSPSEATLSIVPRPMQAVTTGGTLRIERGAVIECDSASRFAAEQLAGSFSHRLGWRPRIEASGVRDADITLKVDASESSLGTEGYRLEISRDEVAISAPTAAGVYYGVQSLAQLLPGNRSRIAELPCALIVDKPRFQWRGMHLDVSRHFFTVEEIKRYLDFLAELKFNVFHWHLIDDGGWRMEVKKYPRLTELGAWRLQREGEVWNYSNIEFHEKDSGLPLHGGYYSQDEIRDVVRYAADRNITVVPEIEMPGHCLPGVVAYPEVGCSIEKQPDRPYRVLAYCPGKERTFEFLEDVLDETMALFPSKVIHIGGDEVDKFYWSKCPDCANRMRSEGLKTYEELQSYFIRRIEGYLNSKGRHLMGWDEILEGGLAPNAMVMSWRGIQGGIEAAKSGHTVVMSPTSHCYFDYGYEGTSTRHVYGYEPIPDELNSEEAQLVLGAQANVWTEWMPNFDRVEYMIYPRILAMAEVLWTPKHRRDWDDFERRLAGWYPIFIERKIDFYSAPPTAEANLIVFEGSATVKLATVPIPGVEVRYTTDGSLPTAESALYKDGVKVTQTCDIVAAMFQGGKRIDPVVRVRCLKGVPVVAQVVGIRFKMKLGAYDKLPDFSTGITEEGNAEEITIAPWAHHEAFALQFMGFIRVQKEGRYRFTVGSDDGSRLRIAGADVVLADRPQAYTESSGDAYLLPGTYPFELSYFERGGAERLELRYIDPDGATANFESLIVK